MNPLRSTRTRPSMIAAPLRESQHPSSGLWSRGARWPSTPPEDAVTVRAPDGRETLPAPDSIATTRASAVAAAMAESGIYDVSIPRSPRVPFVLRPRTPGRWRAEVVAEWVKLSATDPRCE